MMKVKSRVASLVSALVMCTEPAPMLTVPNAPFKPLLPVFTGLYSDPSTIDTSRSICSSLYVPTLV